MLTTQGTDFLQTQIQKGLSHGTALVNGTSVKIPIQKINKKSNILQIFMYIDEAVAGRITQYSLVMKTGHIFMTKTDNIIKDSTRGLLVLFELETKEA